MKPFHAKTKTAATTALYITTTNESAFTAPSTKPSSPNTNTSLVLSGHSLRKYACSIRDDLDPIIAREGPLAIHPDDVLTIHSLLQTLRNNAQDIPSLVIRSSRIYLAVDLIRGKATRWPTKIVEEADKVLEAWEFFHGDITTMRVPLFDNGGRFGGVCKPTEITKESLLRRFAENDPTSIDNSRARRHGSIGFEAGQWWINGLFAFQAGIIDSRCMDSGITWDKNGAYAILVKDHEEFNAVSPDRFTYRCANTDRGRFRLTAADHRARHPVRVLRSHQLSSLWAPRVGVRYDGLYKATGWTCWPTQSTSNADGIRLIYDIHFERVDATPMRTVLRHPLADEMDDFYEYRTICTEQKNIERLGAQALASCIKTGSDWLGQRSVDVDEHISKNDLDSSNQRAVTVKASKMNIMNIKAQIEAANAQAGYGCPRGVSQSHRGAYEPRATPDTIRSFDDKLGTSTEVVRTSRLSVVQRILPRRSSRTITGLNRTQAELERATDGTFDAMLSSEIDV